MCVIGPSSAAAAHEPALPATGSRRLRDPPGTRRPASSEHRASTSAAAATPLPRQHRPCHATSAATPQHRTGAHLEQLPHNAADGAGSPRDEDGFTGFGRPQLAAEIRGHSRHAQHAQVGCRMDRHVQREGSGERSADMNTLESITRSQCIRVDGRTLRRSDGRINLPHLARRHRKESLPRPVSADFALHGGAEG